MGRDVTLPLKGNIPIQLDVQNTLPIEIKQGELKIPLNSLQLLPEKPLPQEHVKP